jgi:uncharacterized repeat protein (TIGR01451 family)
VVTPNAVALEAVDEISPGDVWAVGQQFTEHWDGTAWSVVSSPNIGTLTSVAGTSSSDVWATSSSGQVERWNGASWTVQNTPIPGTVVGASSSTNVWIAGRSSNGWSLARWNGSSWTVVPTPYDVSDYSFYTLSAQSPTDVWLGGGVFNGSHTDNPEIEHWNGTAWSRAWSGEPYDGDVHGFGGTSPTNLYAATYYTDEEEEDYLTRSVHWNGTAWTDMDQPTNKFGWFEDVYAMSPSNVLFVGGFSGEQLWDGSAWHPLDTKLSSTESVSGDADIAWAVGRPETGTGQASDIETYPCPNVDLSVSGTGPKKVEQGQVATFTYTVSKRGPFGATNVGLTDSLPGGLQFASVTTSQGTCTYNEGVTCDLGWVLGDDATVTIKAKVVKTGKLTSTAAVTDEQPDPHQDNNSASVTIQAQPAAPGTPTYHFYQPSQVTNGSPTMVPEETDWTASPVGNICRYDLRVSTNGGSYKPVSLEHPTDLDARVKLAVDDSYRFEVRAHDCAGVNSNWSVGPAFTVDGFQEGAATYSGTHHTWRHAALTGAWGGSVEYTTTAGASATFQFDGRNAAWIGTLGPSYGRADVYVDGVKAKTIDCHAATQSPRQVLFRFRWDTSGPHTIKVVAKTDRIDVDGFVVLR